MAAPVPIERKPQYNVVLSNRPKNLMCLAFYQDGYAEPRVIHKMDRHNHWAWNNVKIMPELCVLGNDRTFLEWSDG